MKDEKKYKLISRRDFVKLAGLAAGGATAGGMLSSDLMAVPERMLTKLAQSKGQESWVNTICRQCPGSCGIKVRRIDGIPVYVKGNPVFPINRGGVCPMAHSSMEVLFHPDRIKNPVKLSGTKGRGDWENTDWNTALSSLSRRIKSLVDAGEGHRIAMINGDDSQLMRGLGKHFMNSIGSQNYFEDERLISNSASVMLSQGIDEVPAYDLANSQYILNFGSNFLEEGASPVYYQQIYGHIRSKVDVARIPIVHIDSRINLTASNADRWIPIKPGTYGALALGIAYLLIVNGLYNKEFVRRNTHGFSPFTDSKGNKHEGFETFVRANYYPERVSEITGIPNATIIQLGDEFSNYSPAIAIADDASRYAENGSFTQWAVYCLNALVGNLQKPGGVYFTPPTPEFKFPQLRSDAQTRNSLAQSKTGTDPNFASPLGDVSIDAFARAVNESDGSAIDTLIIVDSNPVFHARDRKNIIKALHNINNVVYMGNFIDETAEHANVILPDHFYMEKNDIAGPIPGLIFSHVGLVQPVVEPLFDTKQAGDVLIEIGKLVRNDRAYPWTDYKDLVKKRLQAIYLSGAGSIISESSDKEWDKFLKDRGWRFQQYQDYTVFEQFLKENGGWWNPDNSPRRNREIFRTPSGKFEFLSSTLEARLREKSRALEGGTPDEKRDKLLGALGIRAHGDDLLMPHYEVPGTGEENNEYPLLLTVSELITNRAGKGASQPSLLEMVGVQVEKYWKSWVDINPETAREHGLVDHEQAWVESAAGRVQTQVRVVPGIKPGVVHIHLGLGHTSFGRFGTGIGVNAVDLIENKFDTLDNTPALNGTHVKVSSLRMET